MAMWDKKRGRPVKPEGRTESVRVRVRRVELAAIEGRAARLNQTVSAYMRDVALAEAKPATSALDRHDLSRIIVALKAIVDPRVPGVIERVQALLDRIA